MKVRKPKKKIKNLGYKIISVILAIVSIVFIGVLSYLDLLPTKYMILLIVSILIFDLFNIIFLNLKRLKIKVKNILSIFAIIVVIIMSIASFYLCRTLDVLVNNGHSKYKLGHYYVMVLNNSKYKDIEDLTNKDLGYYKNSTGIEEAKKTLNNKINVEFEESEDLNSLISGLITSEYDAIMIEDSMKNILEEESSDKFNQMREIYEFTIEIKVDTTLKEVNVTDESFAIYISGIDTYGQISSVSRSDVNMVMVVNPTTKQILLISIPRDYYVQLHGTTGAKDKLTHAGIYGIDMSIKTIEDLLDTDINYYIKVNFSSVIDIVDSLGGLDVYSDYSFISYSGYNFKAGYNSVNGEQALDFVRTRKAFIDGDRQRGKNQQALIDAIIKKATDKSIITKYNSLLSAVDGKYQTNLSTKKITSLIKMQLEDMTAWNISSYSLTGFDSNDYTYTYNQLLYVMEPDENSVNEAISLIDQVLKNEKLENAYQEKKGSSNKVTQVQVQTEVPENKTTNLDNSKEKEKNEVEETEKKDNKDINEEENVEETKDNEEKNDEFIKDEINNENKPDSELEDDSEINVDEEKDNLQSDNINNDDIEKSLS